MRRSLAILAVVGIAFGSLVPAAGAGESASLGRVTLVEQPPWVPLGGRTALVVGLEGVDDSAELVVTVHEALTSSISFRRTLEREDLGSTIGQVAIDPARLPAVEGGRLFPIDLAPGAAPGAGFPSVGQQGVYPTVVELRDPSTGETSAGFVTYLVVVHTDAAPAPVGHRLRVAWVWPFVAPPAYTPAGTPEPEVVDSLRPTGRLGRLAASVPAPESVPLTLAVNPETLQSWARLAQVPPADPRADLPQPPPDTLPPAGAEAIAGGVRDLRDALEAGQALLAGPYVPIDLPSLLEAEMQPEANDELGAGADTLAAELGRRIDARTAMASPANAASLSFLADGSVDRVLLAEEEVTPIESQFTPAQPFLLAAGNTTLTAATGDRSVTSLLEGDGAPALRAQQFLAALSVVALELPNVARGVVVAPDDDWDVEPDVLDAAVAGLGSHPLLRPVTLDTYFDETPLATTESGEPVVRGLEPHEPAPPPVDPLDWRATANDLEALRTLVPGDDPRLASGARALLVSLSSFYDGTAGRTEARAQLDVITGTVGAVEGLVRAAEDRTVTITARRAEIPITFRNEANEPVRVRVELDSEKLSFPDGSQFLLELAPRSTTERFLVEARTSGTFPLTLRVTSPDGRLEFQESRLTVRSTAVSGVGVVLTVAAAAFLALWWLNHFVRRRRRRRDPRLT